MDNDTNYVSYRILNLEGAWLNKNDNEYTFSTTEDKVFTNKDGKTITIKHDFNKLYTATMPRSLDTIRAFELFPNEELTNDTHGLHTNLFVNFKFTKDYYFEKAKMTDKLNVEKVKLSQYKMNKKRLRKSIYTSVIKINDVVYRFFKRGASKARTANVIFCKSECYDALIKKSLLGLNFDEGKEYDITSKEAYTSLTMSGVIGTINIKPTEILIINDLYSPRFTAFQSVTKMDAKGNIFQDKNKKGFDVENNMTDGQIMIDESIFIENGFLNKASIALLRNDFFKGNGIRTRLQDYYKQNNITKVWDKYRGWIDTNGIKVVITPSALKYLKFSDQFGDDEAKCLFDYLENMDSMFGVVKVDHIGNYGYSNRISYQMINSMNLNYSEVKSLVNDELDYFKLLKDNVSTTSQDLRKMTKKNKHIDRDNRNKMTNYLNLVSLKDDKLSTNDMISAMLKRNIDFRLTQKFKDQKKEQLQDYISNLRLGKIRIKNSIYAVMISCPWEMLVATTKENNKISSCIMTGWEVYCPRYNEEPLIMIRNPQINAGNIGYVTNRWHNEYKWFGYYIDDKPHHDFVVFVNTWNVDLMNRLQGCDFDVDSVYLSNENLLCEKALDSQTWKTPVNGIEGKKEIKKFSNKSLARLDSYLGGSTMAIGKIVNKSAIFNAYMYNAINEGYSDNYINACYDASSKLSSYSQIAIDMAKKSFDGLSLTKEMNKLNKTVYINEAGNEEQILEYNYDYINTNVIPADEFDIKRHKIVRLKYEYYIDKYQHMYEVAEKKMVVPRFFEFIANDNKFRLPTPMECGMDYLEQILDNVDTKAMQTDTIDIKDLLVMQKELDGREFNRTKIDKARCIISKCQNNIKKNRYNSTDSGEETKQKSNLRKWSKKEAVELLKNLELNEKTVYRMVIRAFDIDKSYKPHIMYAKDKNNKVISYKDKEGNTKKITVKEFKDMTMLTLTLLYNAYPEVFIKCFIEKKEDVKSKYFWV